MLVGAGIYLIRTKKGKESLVDYLSRTKDKPVVFHRSAQDEYQMIKELYVHTGCDLDKCRVFLETYDWDLPYAKRIIKEAQAL